MKKKINSNICLWFKANENGRCRHYGGKENILEACFDNCKKIKKKKNNKSKTKNMIEECYVGVEVE